VVYRTARATITKDLFIYQLQEIFHSKHGLQMVTASSYQNSENTTTKHNQTINNKPQRLKCLCKI